MRTFLALAAAALLVPQAAVRAQERKDPALYKVEFNIRDGSGAAGKPALHYALLTELNHKAVFKVGSRVPVATGSFQPGVGGVGVNPLVSTQYTYLDVGVNIECQLSDANGRISLHGVLDISSVAEHESAPHANPTLVQTRLDLETALDPGKPAVVAAIDDPASTRHFQVEAIVTRAN